MKRQEPLIGPAIGLVSGIVMVLCAQYAMNRLLRNLLPDWPDWHANTISHD